MWEENKVIRNLASCSLKVHIAAVTSRSERKLSASYRDTFLMMKKKEIVKYYFVFLFSLDSLGYHKKHIVGFHGKVIISSWYPISSAALED